MTAGDVQWMTAGSGILHQEMPKGDPQGRMHGFQLWANLPSSLKMTDPRYQDIPSSAIPEVTEDDGTKARIICGEFWGKKGPVEGVAADPNYIDVSVPPGKRKRLKVETTRNAFAYVFAGSGTFRDASDPQAVLTESGADPNAPPVYDARTTRSCSSTAATKSRSRPARGHPLPARLRQADRGARRLVRPHRDEHAGAAPPGHDRTLAEGADRIVAHAGLALGADLQCPLPFLAAEYCHDFEDAASRDEFHNLLAKASAVFQIEGSRAREDESYERVGRMVVEQSDLLIAIWDGEPAAGRGGTTQIVEEALAQHTPVVWLNASEPKDPCILRADKSGKRQTCALDELKPILAARFSDREDSENSFNFSHAYFAEKQPNFDPGRIFRIFRDLVARGRLRLDRGAFRISRNRRATMGEDDCQLPRPARRRAPLPARPALPPLWLGRRTVYLLCRSSSLELAGDQPHGCILCPGSHGGLRLRTTRHRPRQNSRAYRVFSNRHHSRHYLARPPETLA
jgi:hypothetical protein